MAAVDGENYLDRVNCEYTHESTTLMQECGCAVKVVHQSEREDWIQNMVAGGLGICFLPEFSAVVPGVQTRPVSNPKSGARSACLAEGSRAFAGRPALCNRSAKLPLGFGKTFAHGLIFNTLWKAGRNLHAAARA